MASRALNYLIGIDANGTPAIGELNKVERAVEGIDDSIDDIAEPGRLDGFKGAFADAAGSLGAMAGPASVGALAAGIFKIASDASELAVSAGQTAEALGLSAEDASALNAAFTDAGYDAAALVGLAFSITEGLQDSPEILDRLGLKAEEVVDPIDAIRAGIDNWDLLTPIERAKLFGEEGVLAISKMVGEGESLEDIIEGIDSTRIFSDEDIARGKEYEAAVAEIKGAWEGVVIELSGSVVPALTEILSVSATIVETLNKVKVGGEDGIGIFSSLFDLGKYVKDGWVDLYNEINGEDFDEAKVNVERYNEIIQSGARDSADAIDEIGAAVDGIPTNKTVVVGVDTSFAAQQIAAFYRSLGSSPTPVQPVSGPRNITVNLGRAVGMREVNRAIVDWTHANG
jgi:methyl-accepting chemotaxis protein